MMDLFKYVMREASSDKQKARYQKWQDWKKMKVSRNAFLSFYCVMQSIRNTKQKELELNLLPKESYVLFS